MTSCIVASFALNSLLSFLPGFNALNFPLKAMQKYPSLSGTMNIIFSSLSTADCYTSSLASYRNDSFYSTEFKIEAPLWSQYG